jgi:hypothetical protein
MTHMPLCGARRAGCGLLRPYMSEGLKSRRFMSTPGKAKWPSLGSLMRNRGAEHIWVMALDPKIITSWRETE